MAVHDDFGHDERPASMNMISPSTTAPDRACRQGTLDLRGVGKMFSAGGDPFTAVADFNLTVAPGAFVAIVGASGCGKSTMLRLIAGLDRPDAGSILVDGAPVRGPALDRGLIFQEPRLMPWLTVEQNIGLALKHARLPAREKAALITSHLRLVGLEDFARAYPRQLSGGMAQRAAIARGLVNRPNILLLDEPFGALDALTRVRLQDELQRIWLAEGITMVLVTHDVEEAVFLADEVIVMTPRPGRILLRSRISLPHPRHRADAAFHTHKTDILAALGLAN